MRSRRVNNLEDSFMNYTDSGQIYKSPNQTFSISTTEGLARLQTGDLSACFSLSSPPQNTMALNHLSLKFPLTRPPTRAPALSSTQLDFSKQPRVCTLRSPTTKTQIGTTTTTIRAVEESQGSAELETQAEEELKVSETAGSTVELSELGAEIKKAMEQRKEKSEGNLLSGVGEEIKEIEWPAFAKVLGTTGVVLGVIAGSSVVLLTVNAVLAELSDKVFSGKGIQNFFG